MFGIQQRKRMVKIGKELGTLCPSDIDYIMDPKNSETDVQRRMRSARIRSTQYERKGACYYAH